MLHYVCSCLSVCMYILFIADFSHPRGCMMFLRSLDPAGLICFKMYVNYDFSLQ